MRDGRREKERDERRKGIDGRRERDREVRERERFQGFVQESKFFIHA